MDDSSQNGRENKPEQEAEIPSSVEVDLKTKPKVLLTLDDPSQNDGENKAEILSPVRVDLNANTKVLPLTVVYNSPQILSPRPATVQQIMEGVVF